MNFALGKLKSTTETTFVTKGLKPNTRQGTETLQRVRIPEWKIVSVLGKWTESLKSEGDDDKPWKPEWTHTTDRKCLRTIPFNRVQT